MRSLGWSAWVVLATTACRWGFANEPLDGASGDAATDGGGQVTELCTAHWCWERPPPPEQRSLRALGGSSATNVWAVGDGGVIRRWDGASWTVLASPTNDGLTAVDVVSATDVTVAASAGVLWHYDGNTWTSSTLASESTVAALWRAPDNTLWAAGDVGTVSIDGLPATGVPAGYAATALDGNATTSVWHAGFFNAVSRWNGSAWGSVLISDFPTAVIAKGTGAFVGGTNIWSCDMALGCSQVFATAYVRDFYRLSDSNIWAVGGLGHIEQFDGSSWKAVASPVTANLTSVWASSATDVWAVGEDGTILHLGGAGSSWTSVGNEQPVETGYGALWVGADDDIWLGGAYKMWHSDGGTPVMSPLPAGAMVGDEIEGNGANDVYAYDFGNKGVLHFDGSSWSLDPSLTTLSSTGGGLATNATETLATDLVGNIYRKPAGGSFSTTYTSGGTEWHGACFAPNGDALVVGRFGSAALRTSGVWAMHNPPTGRFMVACSFAGTTGWAIGGDFAGKLVGTTWTAQATKTTQNVTDVLAVSDTEVYIVATSGRIVRYDGAEWEEEASPVVIDLDRLARSTSGTIYAVGHSPGMLRRR